MQLVRTVLVFLACLVLPGKSASMEDQSRSSSAVSLLLKSQGPGKVDTKTLVSSLNEVAKGLHTEDKKAFDLAQQVKSDCQNTNRDLKLALSKGKHTRDMATNDYQKTSAQVNALQASLAELQGQVTGSGQQLDSLQGQLKKMRADKGLLKKGASSALRQVEAVIAKTYRMEMNDHHKGPSALEKKVSSLEELSKSLSFLQAEQTSDEEKEDNTEAAPVEKQAPVLILKADKQAVVRASDATQKGFNEEEKKLIDLVEVERKKLEDLEDNMADLQPAITDKLKQAMEINRTLDAAERGMERDHELMKVENQKCTVTQDSLGKQKKARNAVANDVSMASKVLEHMDTALFLTKDLQGLKRASPSFLQVNKHSSLEEASAPVVRALSFLQEGDGMDLEQLVENYDSSTSGNEGPFDKVTKMIGGLIASLKAQANEEVNQHQFCQDSLSKNRRDRIAKKNTIDTLTSTIRWSKMAIVRLDDDLSYLGQEMSRLSNAQTAEGKELIAETARVNKELKEHKLADEVITKCIVILTQLCDLGASLIQDDSEPALIQRQRQSSKVGSRFGQCKEAANLLKSASKGVKALDTMTSGYLTEYSTLSKKIKADAKAAEEARNTQLKSTKAARAQRASELATSNKDVKEAAKELVLIQTAKEELEHSCTHVETREEKMARRKEEIDALKEALNVLQGEAVPA